MALLGADAVGGSAAVMRVPLGDDRKGFVPMVALVNGDGSQVNAHETLTLVDNSVVALPQSSFGGDYIVRAFATNWNGGTAKIQFLEADGATWSDLANPDGSIVAAFTANRTLGVGLTNSTLRAVLTGAPTKLYVTVGRMS